MLIEPAELERRAAELRERLSDWELGYLTGLTEGEGSLKIYFDKRIKKMYPEITIVNTNYEVLNYFIKKLNIGHIYNKKEKGNRAPSYVWFMRGRAALIFLKLIFNGLISCKRVKAALLFALNIKNFGLFAMKLKEKINYLNSFEENLYLNKLCSNKFRVKNNVREFDIGFMAGLTDSEGNISIFKQMTAACVTITSTCPKLILKILNLFRGWELHLEKEGPLRRRCYYLRLFNKNAKEFLELIKDYLIIKKQRAEIALEFIKTLGKQRKYVSPEIKKMREKLYWKLRELNMRGPMYSGGPTALALSIPVLPFPLKWSLPRPLSLLDA